MKKLVSTIVGVIISMVTLCSCSSSPLISEYMPDRVVRKINYNNFIGGNNNYIDYSDNKFAFLNMNTLTIMDTNWDSQKIKGVSAPFQLHKENVLFVQKGTLFLKNIDTGDKITIAEDVNHFILHDDKILYSAQKYSKLYSYGLENCETTELYTSEKIRQFSVYEDEIFIIDEKDCLIKISFDGKETQTLLQLDIYGYPYKVLHIKDKIIMQYYNSIEIIDLKAGSKEKITIDEDQNANNRFSFICDDEHIYVSYGVRNTDGSIVTDVESDKNGVWRINISTKQKEKISPVVFSALFLYDGDLLLGYVDGKIQQVNKN